MDNEPRARKTAFYNNLFDQISKLNIKKSYVCKGKNMDKHNFVCQEFDKVKNLILIKNVMNVKQRNNNLKIIRYDKTAETNYSNVNQETRHKKYYKRNTHTTLSLNCDSKFTDCMFLQRVRDHFTAHKIYTMNFNKYKIRQVMFPVIMSSIMELTEGKNIIKESRFSYIRQVDGITRLKVYNCTNITGLENVVCSQAIVEIPNGCLILFTEDNFHAGVITFEKGNSSYSSNFRFFSYIVENEHINRDDNITTLKPRMVCNANSLTCQSICQRKLFIILDI